MNDQEFLDAAALAMLPLCVKHFSFDIEKATELSYEIAEAMLEQRRKVRAAQEPSYRAPASIPTPSNGRDTY